VKRVWPAIGIAIAVLVIAALAILVITFFWFNPKDSHGIGIETAANDAALARFTGQAIFVSVVLAIVAGVATYIFRTPKSQK
jgi:multisubunit Na+/H+ antiporter MnhB subunit